MKKKTLKQVASCVVVLALLIGSLKWLTDLLERKKGNNKYADFFTQEEDFDVLFFGTSHVLNGIFPMELWNDYGIISYNWGNHSCALPTSYWLRKIATEDTSPSLVVVDCYGLSLNEKIERIEHLHTAVDAFPTNRLKVDLLTDLLSDGNDETEKRLALFWNYILYHSRWDNLNENDFLGINLEKGAETRIELYKNDDVNKIPRTSKYTGDSVGILYLEKIIEECKSEGISVLLIYLPWQASKERQMEANRVYDIAEKYDVNYINFLDEDAVNYKTDMADSTPDNGHLNPSGARKITDYIGKYIRENYDIEDRRTNEVYDDWYSDYEEYCLLKDSNFRAQGKLDIYLMLLADKGYDIILETNTEELWRSNQYSALLENIGIEVEKLAEETNLIVVSKGGKEIQYFDTKCSCSDAMDTCVGSIEMDTDELGINSIYLDGIKIGETISEETEQRIVKITVMRSGTTEVIDSVSFSTSWEVKHL